VQVLEFFRQLNIASCCRAVDIVYLPADVCQSNSAPVLDAMQTGIVDNLQRRGTPLALSGTALTFLNSMLQIRIIWPEQEFWMLDPDPRLQN
jgi:hypothetical protein